MRRGAVRALALAAVTALGGCGGDDAPPAGPDESTLSIAPRPGFPAMRVPADNPWTVAKAELGRYLFYDRRLSGNQTQSCGSCHQQSRAFTDSRGTALGSTGEAHPRGSMALANVGYFSTLTWASSVVRTLEAQALVPLFGDNPVELGMAGREAELLQRLRADARYPGMFAAAFPGESEPITVANLAKAIASFERALVSADSPFDRAQRGVPNAMTAAAQRGRELFFSERTECFHCHGGFANTDSVAPAGSFLDELSFHNTGLYNVDGRGGYPAPNTGLHAQTGNAADMGRFRAPSLRNIALTAPYMHDGSIATLEEVIDTYAAGGRNIVSGPNAGDGRANPNKSGFIVGFTLTPQERADLVAFLQALTDTRFVTDPRYADPFGNER